MIQNMSLNITSDDIVYNLDTKHEKIFIFYNSPKINNLSFCLNYSYLYAIKNNQNNYTCK